MQDLSIVVEHEHDTVINAQPTSGSSHWLTCQLDWFVKLIHDQGDQSPIGVNQ